MILITQQDINYVNETMIARDAFGYDSNGKIRLKDGRTFEWLANGVIIIFSADRAELEVYENYENFAHAYGLLSDVEDE